MYIYIYIYTWMGGLSQGGCVAHFEELADHLWLRTNGVSTNGAAAKVMNFDRLGKKVRPGTFGNIKVG